MQVSKQMVLISGRINRPRVKDWPDMWCFPGQGCGSNVSMARSQDQSPLVPVLSSLTPPLRFCPFSIHKIGLVVGLSSGAPVMLSSPPWCPLLSSWWWSMVGGDLPYADAVAPGDLIWAWTRCWLIHKMLAGWRRAQAGPHVTTRGEQWAADSGPPPVTTTGPASQKMNEILILSSLCKPVYSTTFPNFLKLLRFHSKHSILKILNTRTTGATAPHKILN